MKKAIFVIIITLLVVGAVVISGCVSSSEPDTHKNTSVSDNQISISDIEGKWYSDSFFDTSTVPTTTHIYIEFNKDGTGKMCYCNNDKEIIDENSFAFKIIKNSVPTIELTSSDNKVINLSYSGGKLIYKNNIQLNKVSDSFKLAESTNATSKAETEQNIVGNWEATKSVSGIDSFNMDDSYKMYFELTSNKKGKYEFTRDSDGRKSTGLFNWVKATKNGFEYYAIVITAGNWEGFMILYFDDGKLKLNCNGTVVDMKSVEKSRL